MIKILVYFVMASCKFIHAADIHLDSPLHGLSRYEGAPVQVLRGATRRAFENLIHLALQEAVDFIVLAGDLYDGDWRDYNTGLYFNQQINRLKAKNIRVFIVQGNHDAASQISKHLPLPDHVHVFSAQQAESVLIEDLELVIHGQSFAQRAVMEDLSLNYPPAEPHLFNLGLLHTSLEGHQQHDTYAPCTLEGLQKKGYQYWALGHIHQRQVLHQDPWIVFPGNLQGRHIRETGAKGCYLVEVAQRKVQSCQFHALDVLRWSHCRLNISGMEQQDEVLDAVQDALHMEIQQAEERLIALRLELYGATALHRDLQADKIAWQNQLRGLAASFPDQIWLEKIIFNTQEVRDLSSEHEELFKVMQQLQRSPQSLLKAIYPLQRKFRISELDFNPDQKILFEQALALLIHHLYESD